MTLQKREALFWASESVLKVKDLLIFYMADVRALPRFGRESNATGLIIDTEKRATASKNIWFFDQMSKVQACVDENMKK